MEGKLHCDPGHCATGECEDCQRAQRAFADVVAECCWCGRGIVAGDEVYEIDLGRLAALVGRDLYRHLRSRESNLMHERCWDKCTVVLDLFPNEAEWVATLVIAGDESDEFCPPPEVVVCRIAQEDDGRRAPFLGGNGNGNGTAGTAQAS